MELLELDGLNGNSAQAYRKNGFIIVRNLFDVSADIDSLRLEMSRIFLMYLKKNAPLQEKDIIDLYASDLQGFLGCADLCQYTLGLYKLNTHSGLIKLLKEIGLEHPTMNTRPLVSFSCKSLAKNDSYWKVPAHQDWPSTQGSLNGLTCWIPLVDVDEKLGALEVLPGSHLNGVLPHSDSNGVPVLDCGTEQSGFLPIALNRGDAVLFSNFLVHRSGLNQFNDKIRWSIHFRFDDAAEESFKFRKYPRHRTDVRKPGILHENFPSKAQLLKAFGVDTDHS